MAALFDQTDEVSIKKSGKVILKGKPLYDLISVCFKINKHVSNDVIYKLVKTSVNSSHNYKICHKRLDYISQNKFLEIKSKEILEDNSQMKNIFPPNDTCEACIYGKQTRLPFSKAKYKSHITRPLFIIHSYVCGPITPTTLNNKNYFVTFIDEFTHYKVTYLLAYKSEVLTVFQDFVRKSEAHFNLKIVNLYCDNGGEYVSNKFKEFCVQKSITFII